MLDRRSVLLGMAAAASAGSRATQGAGIAFEDAERLPTGSTLEADVCIVGAGAAGITIARELADTNLSVLLLEAGGMKVDGRDQALFRWGQSGQHYFDLAACRLRCFGGTTNHWAGYSTAPQALDFEPRPDLGIPGWPVGHATLAPYFERAARSLGHADSRFDAVEAALAVGEPADAVLDSQAVELKTCLFRIGRRHRFGERHGAALAAQPGLRVLLHANVVHLQLDSSRREVSAARLRSFGGPQVRVRARRWVLAAHALENARLLLASNDVAPEGIGNAHDQVGRCFMEHPVLRSGLLIPTRRFPNLYDEQWGSARHMNWTIGLADAQMQRHGALNHQCRLIPVYAHDRVRLAGRRLLAKAWQPADAQTAADLATLLRHPGDVLGLVARSLAGVAFPALGYRLEQRIEQAPNPESRVLLTSELDALGMPKARLHWALNDIDARTFAVGHEVLARAFGRLGLGRVEGSPISPELMRGHVGGLNHHAGTARMSRDPRFGVVDSDCRVHGVGNLYVAGSAVFPRIGLANPTLPIVALAMRLADHLKTGGST